MPRLELHSGAGACSPVNRLKDVRVGVAPGGVDGVVRVAAILEVGIDDEGDNGKAGLGGGLDCIEGCVEFGGCAPVFFGEQTGTGGDVGL